MTKKINISVLNLVPVREGSNATGAFEDMIKLAKCRRLKLPALLDI